MEEFLRSIPAAGSIPYAFIAFAIAGCCLHMAKLRSATSSAQWSCPIDQFARGLQQVLSEVKDAIGNEEPVSITIVAPKAQSSSANTCVIDRYVIRRIRYLAKQRF
jgi:hypothetical protein